VPCGALWHLSPVSASTSLFLPGWGARAQFYAPGLPPGWEAVELPAFRTAPTMGQLRTWLRHELDRRTSPVSLAGHSMGAALAILAAADTPSAVRSLVLVGPAGLPMRRLVTRSLTMFATQIAHRRFPVSNAFAGAAGILRSPRQALRLGHEVQRLDLSPEMRAVRESGVPTTVVSCVTDTLVTPADARRTADLTGGHLVEYALPGGHLWMFSHWEPFAAQLAAAP
jgi:pimeloyl-ACP methyl ester carboxylesterase